MYTGVLLDHLMYDFLSDNRQTLFIPEVFRMSIIQARLLAKPQSIFEFLDGAERETLEAYRAYGKTLLVDMPDNAYLRENIRNLGIALEHTHKLEALWVPLRGGGIKKNIREATVFQAHGMVQDPAGMANTCKEICREMDTMLALEQKDSIPKRDWEKLHVGASGLLKEALKRTPKH